MNLIVTMLVLFAAVFIVATILSVLITLKVRRIRIKSLENRVAFLERVDHDET